MHGMARRGEARQSNVVSFQSSFSEKSKMAKKTTTTTATNGAQVIVKAPHFQTAEFKIRGTAPYVTNKFSKRARLEMRSKQEEGHTARKGKAKEAKDFEQCYKESIHRSKDGWEGIPAPAFRNAMISACRVVGFQMTRAKLSVFCEADGFDEDDGTPLVRITKGKPHYAEHVVRLQGVTTDIRARGMWDEGWEATVRIRFDADQFTLQDVTNLFVRAGMQVGVGEGRPDSKTSAGQGWGTFEVLGA